MSLGEDVVLTAQIINSALSRCPELFHALKEQASHACIAKNVVKTDLGRARDAVASQSPVVFSDDEDEYEEDAIADDEYVDVDGVVRPKGLGVHNSLINWTNKAVPLGRTVSRCAMCLVSSANIRQRLGHFGKVTYAPSAVRRQRMGLGASCRMPRRPSGGARLCRADLSRVGRDPGAPRWPCRVSASRACPRRRE